MPIITDNSISWLRTHDPIFKTIVSTYGVPPSWSREPGFETLSRIILEQQVSLQSAKAAYEKLSDILLEFTPFYILKLSADQMRKATVSRQKASYIQGLAQLIIDSEIDLGNLKNIPIHEARDLLITIRGIGSWTAEVYLLFCLQAPDIFPKGDVALNNTVKELKNVKSNDDVYQIAENWSPHRSTAAFLLWHYYLCKRGREFVI